MRTKINKRHFKNYILNQYESNELESVSGRIFKPGANHAAINWNRFYKIFDLFLKNKLGDMVKTVLDIGAYPGTLSLLLRRYMGYCCNLTLIDTKPMYSHEFWNEIDIDKSHKLKFSDGWIDTVFFCDIIEHLVSPLYSLKEIYRVLKPGGLLIISTDNIIDAGNILNMIFGKTCNQELSKSHVYYKYKHIRVYADYELKQLLSSIGFTDIKIERCNIQHKFRKRTIGKWINYCIRSIFYIIPMYRPKLFVTCKK